MVEIKNKVFGGLNANQLKIIALIAMTIDHLPVYLTSSSIIMAADSQFRIIGRIAAPLFLYLIVSSAHHTSNKGRLLLRLYLANLIMGISSIIVNLIGISMHFQLDFSDIFPTFFYAVLYCYVIEGILTAIKTKNKLRFVKLSLVLLLSYLPIVISNGIINHSWIDYFLPNATSFQIGLIYDMQWSIIPSILQVDYTLIFVLMGILWYFTRKKLIHVSILIIFSLACYITPLFVSAMDLGRLVSFFGPPQPYMILAAPFIYLYNHTKGSSHKYFFYIYYPLHQYMLLFLGLAIKAIFP